MYNTCNLHYKTKHLINLKDDELHLTLATWLLEVFLDKRNKSGQFPFLEYPKLILI